MFSYTHLFTSQFLQFHAFFLLRHAFDHTQFFNFRIVSVLRIAFFLLRSDWISGANLRFSACLMGEFA